MWEGNRMKSIHTFTLKMIAIVTMLVDHIGYAFFPEMTILRMIGRISFPIFAYVLAEGFVYTKDVKKYMLRLGVFALLSEIPYDLVIMGEILEFSHQNVFFTLFFGVLMMFLMSKTRNIILQYAVVATLTLLCQCLRTDYSDIGLLLIFVFYVFRLCKKEKLLLAGLILLTLTGENQWYAILALPLIALHNGEQGPKLKAFFYIFYPMHLLVLYWIQWMI